MQDPRREIVQVVHDLTATSSPDVQLETLNRYFTLDASFNHPICKVNSRSNSLKSIISIFQWYKIMSPVISLTVRDVGVNEAGNTIYLHMEQVFHIFFSPFHPHTARLVTKLDLIRDSSDGLYRISRQEDWYQPEDFVSLIIPILSHPILLVKSLATLICVVYAYLFQTILGWWKPVSQKQG